MKYTNFQSHMYVVIRSCVVSISGKKLDNFDEFFMLCVWWEV